MEKMKKGKIIIFALLIGILVGAVDALFGRVLIALSAFRTDHFYYLIPFLPLAGLFIVWSYRYFSRLSLKGMTLVFEAAQNKRDDIPLALIPLVMLGTWITHLFGASAGREGVAVQIGATLSHNLGKRLGIPEGSRIMLVTGMAAGFAGLFQTPLTAVFFAMEVVVAGFMDYSAMLPALIAAFTASFTSHAFGLEKFSVSLTDSLIISGPQEAAKVICLGLAFGLTGFAFSFFLGKAKKKAGELCENQYLRIGAASIPLAILLCLLWGGRYSGLGTNLIAESFGGEIMYWDFLLKLILTIASLAIGFQGGEVTPLFSIGASLGCVLGPILGLPATVCAALGYAAVFGSATNTLIAPILIGLEVFGGSNMLAFVLVCVIAYLVNGDVSIYAAQSKIRDPH